MVFCRKITIGGVRNRGNGCKWQKKEARGGSERPPMVGNPGVHAGEMELTENESWKDDASRKSNLFLAYVSELS